MDRSARRQRQIEMSRDRVSAAQTRFQRALEVSAAFALLGAVIAASTIRKHRHMDAADLVEAAA